MNDLLQQGIAAYKAGKLAEARKIFLTVIKQSPDSEPAWGWMYEASNDDKERIYCLNQMLRINPKNEKANQMLNLLLAPPLSSISPITQPRFPTPAEPSLKQDNSSVIVTKRSGIKTWIIASLITFFIIICCIYLVAIINSPLSSNSQKSKSTSIQVKYVITGPSQTPDLSALITYLNVQGGTEQVSGHLPYVKYLWVEPGTILSLIAQKENYAGGTITCEIWIRGEKTKTSTSSAEYGVVTCSDVAQ